MKKTPFVVTAVALMGVLAAAAALRAQDEPLDPRIAKYDKGPAKIDVSKYPAEMQQNYKVFLVKCAKCHTVARAINSDFALEGEWERYVKRMMNKAGTFISPAEGKQIFDFAVYDSKTRKKDLYDRKSKDLAK
jgi:mono/diheme cytochrome c family protein